MNYIEAPLPRFIWNRLPKGWDFKLRKLRCFLSSAGHDWKVHESRFGCIQCTRCFTHLSADGREPESLLTVKRLMCRAAANYKSRKAIDDMAEGINNFVKALKYGITSVENFTQAWNARKFK